MGQHRAFDHIADGINALNARAKMLIDRDAALLIAPDARLIEPKALRVRNTSYGDQHRIGLEPFHSAAFTTFDAHLHRCRPLFRSAHLGGKLEGQTLLGEEALELLGKLEVHAGKYAIEIFHLGDVCPEPPPHRSKLQADDPRPHHHQMFRHLFET